MAKTHGKNGWAAANEGVEQSKSEAAKWYRRAAQNGYELSDDERKIFNSETLMNQINGRK